MVKNMKTKNLVLIAAIVILVASLGCLNKTEKISLETNANNPKNKAPVAPTIITVLSDTGDNSNNGDMRATINTPAVTIVAA